MSEHTPAEWQELIGKLKAVIADESRSRGDRSKAQDILNSIERPHTTSPTAAVRQSEGRQSKTDAARAMEDLDMDYGGAIV